MIEDDTGSRLRIFPNPDLSKSNEQMERDKQKEACMIFLSLILHIS